MERMVDRVFGARDPQLVGYPFMDSPAAALGLAVVYLVFVLRVGPDYMRHRKPVNVTVYVRAFNVFQVISHLIFLPLLVYYSLYRLRFSLVCQQPFFDAYSTDKARLSLVCYGYLCVRTSDYLDTVFFVLAKKFSHVSFLHVYHHLIVALGGWLFLRQGWVFSATLGAILNMSIHIVMYTYYLLATYPSMKPHLGWKRQITRMQLAQFVIMLVQGVHVARHKTFCWVPFEAAVFGICNVVIFLVLFGHFYWKAYSGQKAIRAASAKATKTE